jgi:bifunctional non-homologous end joining protein LigD
MNTAATTPQAQWATLHYRDGSSDRVCQAAIEPQGELFVVKFAYGRRGSTMNTGTKTQAPVDCESAKALYDKLIREKMAKGYAQGPDSTP